MASQLLVNGDDQDPYKAKGHIELRIEDFAGFAQQQVDNKRCSDPVYVCGVPWKILATVREFTRNGRKQKCFGFFLQCNNGSTDPFWSISATAQMKMLAQKEGKADHVRQIEHIFHAKENDWGYANLMTFEALMGPNSGWYDERTDCIRLAVDFKAEILIEAFDNNFVVVAQNELKLDTVPLHFSMQIGNLEWEISFNADQNMLTKSLVLSCKNVAKDGRVKRIMLELFGYRKIHPKSEAYYPIFDEKGAAAVHRHLFTAKDNSMTVKVPGGRASDNILFTVRVLKGLNMFPDFTEQTTKIGRFPADVKLRVGDQTFHANKQLLSTLSPFFDRNFNGLFDAAKQQEVELSLVTHSPELFHHFLLVMFNSEALPNSMNVAALFKLADFYDVENVREKCVQHIRMAREMPIEKRVLLARKHGTKEMVTEIMDSANFTQLKAINLMLLQNCSI